MCRHTSFAIPDGEGDGCVVCSGSRFDCSICCFGCCASVRISCGTNDATCKYVKFVFDGPHGDSNVVL